MSSGGDTCDNIPAGAFDALAALYAEVAAACADLQHGCTACGRCCRFSEMDHTLFASQLETCYHVRCHGWRAVKDEGVCPWQEGAVCTAREGRPLGCRVYFCSATDERIERLSTDAHARLKAIHEAFGIPWSYAPFLRHLAAESG